MSSTFVSPTNLISQGRRNYIAAQWRILQKKTKTNELPMKMSSMRKRMDVTEDLLQRNLDGMKQDLNEKMVGLELVKQRLNELEKEKLVSVGMLHEVMSVVANRLDKLEDVQVKLISTEEFLKMTNKLADTVTDRFSQIEATVEEKITTCLDDCGTTMDEKVTMCYEECASQFAQQFQAVNSSVEKTLVVKLEKVMEKMEFNLMVRFFDMKPDFDEYQSLQKTGQTQRKKHKPR